MPLHGHHTAGDGTSMASNTMGSRLQYTADNTVFLSCRSLTFGAGENQAQYTVES